MKKFAVCAYVIVGILLAVGFVNIANAQSISIPQGGAHLEVEFIQTFNHVVFTVTWITDDPNGTWPFHFGDGTEYVLVGESGMETFSHDYAYTPGGIICYLASIELNGWTDPWSDIITIDDRPPESYFNFMPIVFKPAPISSCSIQIDEQNINYVVFDVSWQNAKDGVHTFEFGDGSMTQQFSGIEGNGQVWHDYPWPQENFIAMMQLDGGGSCSVDIIVDWP
ncbi:hypothetical protein A2W13_03860 [Candidatus Woesebacteria bacterium RBG_16_36_11]|uniref:Uncharacterized protein n=3 Tax=Candidatus Woeseibacteriota TaxID=1752722 RepID=A0A1F7XBW2_9BACT|nr:MAG: hypothetical protein A2Z67_00780 [Candidatus Woesebacteria bacterium RBG_13_36_22]OGM11815.1 MAG: hypothetical protein A2W13_03860 [Candidatus Woesebacteria bacterium RBG_16_36_11]OGM17572.1 MAG: hypothetical protein A2V55_00775 [Candidatus Woesebacteria bacterium RBG_19FT_COMBO_37_29]